MLENGWCDGVLERLDGLFRLHALCKVLRQARAKRGAIDFETVETRILFDENRKIDAIVPVNRTTRTSSSGAHVGGQCRHGKLS